MGSEVRRFPGQAGLWIEDLQTGWSIAHQADRRFRAASVVKIPMMVACLEAVEGGRIDLSDTLTYRASQWVSGSGVLKGMPSGSVLRVDQLIEWMITRSDNIAANLLMDHLGMESFNRSFKERGLAKTNLSRKMMDFRKRGQGIENYTTAQDMASSLRQIYRREGVSPAVSEKCLLLLAAQEIRDRIPKQLPPGTVVAHKTGLERGVCHDAGIVYTKGGNFLICVLTQRKGPSAPSKKFIARLASLTYHTLN